MLSELGLSFKTQRLASQVYGLTTREATTVAHFSQVSPEMNGVLRPVEENQAADCLMMGVGIRVLRVNNLILDTQPYFVTTIDRSPGSF